MKQFIIRVLSLFLTVSCAKEKAIILPSPPSFPDNTDYLEIKWERNIVAELNRQSSLSAPPFLFGNKVVIDTEFPDSSTEGQPFYFIDTLSKEIVFAWNDYTIGGRLFYNDFISQSGKYLILGSQNAVDVIDMSTGQTQWGHQVPRGFAGVYPYGNYVYKGADTDNWGQIWRGNLETGLWEMVYHHNKEQGFKPFFVGIEHTVAPNGDELVIWKNWSLKGMTQDRTEFFCYNLTHDSLMWRSDQYMTSSCIYKVEAVDNIVIGLLKHTVIAMDLVTGQTIWERDMRLVSACANEMDFTSAAVHVNQDHIILVYDACAEVAVLDLFSGQVLRRWPYISDNSYSNIEGKFTHYNGKLFFVSQAELQVIDDYTGQPLFDPKRLNHLGGRLWNGVAIDSATQSMYIHNGQKLFCLRIPPDLR